MKYSPYLSYIRLESKRKVIEYLKPLYTKGVELVKAPQNVYRLVECSYNYQMLGVASALPGVVTHFHVTIVMGMCPNSPFPTLYF